MRLEKPRRFRRLLSAANAPPPRGDLKAALLVFRQVLKASDWADDTAPLAHVGAAACAGCARSRRCTAPGIAACGCGEHQAPRQCARGRVRTNCCRRAAALARAGDESGEKPSRRNWSRTKRRITSRPSAPNGGPPLPYRGAPLSAQQPAAPTITPDTPPHESAERLLAATDGALARTTLLQAASLPDQPTQRTEPAAQRWTFEVPFATPQGTSIAQFEVSRDGQAAKSDRKPPTWRARFSLDVEPMGPVHALVALAGARTSVTLWAERHATAARLNDNAAMLSEALRAAELEPADVLFRVGAPPNVARQAAPGRFMDRAT